jgi:hypothetical protein
VRKYQNSFVAFLLKAVLSASLMFPSALTHAANIFWTGPNFTYTHAPNDPSADMLTTNHTGTDFANNVFLTRGAYYPLYNAAAESGWNASVSPANTLWQWLRAT